VLDIFLFSHILNNSQPSIILRLASRTFFLPPKILARTKPAEKFIVTQTSELDHHTTSIMDVRNIDAVAKYDPETIVPNYFYFYFSKFGLSYIYLKY
jgi:hypothetical protein